MSLGVALNNAVSGLRLNQQSLAVLSNNIANVNTEGYSRQIVNQTAVYVAGQGNGVQIEGIIRKVDDYLARSVQTQGSQLQYANTVNSYYQNLQVLLGSPGSTTSLDEDFTTFFNTMQQLAEQPDRTSYRSNFVNSANILADHVSSTAYEIENLRYQADSDLASAVTEVNAALKKLYELNGAIARASAAKEATVGMLDERDKALTILSQNLSISTSFNPNGTVEVTSANGSALVDGALHQLSYSKAQSIETLIQDRTINPLIVKTIDANGAEVGVPSILVTGGSTSQRTSGLGTGKMQGLVELRDDLMPEVLNQLDMLASRLRDGMNALHNNGSGYPGATSLTGTRAVAKTDTFDWSGSVRIAVLQADGSPIPSVYSNESTTGFRPLTLDLAKLSSGGAMGQSDIETIMDEINNHFGVPSPKTTLGDINNIQLASLTNQVPSGATSLFNFNLDLENISGNNSKLFITGMSVADENGVALSNSVTKDAPSIALSGTNSYTTHVGESRVDVALSTSAGLKVGDTIYLTPPAGSVDGINAADLGGFFTITAINGNSVTINAANGSLAATGTTVNDGSGVTARPAYATSLAGSDGRTSNPLQVDFSNAIASEFYDITLNVTTINDDGVASNATITYRIKNGQTDVYNDRFSSQTVTGDATRTSPNTTQAPLRAILVDANGVELAKVNGRYVNEDGYLKLVSDNPAYTISIDEMNSVQLGNVAEGVAATNWGFSHFFGLNNFFDDNTLSDTGDSLKNSAINLAVQKRLTDNPNLVTSGRLTLSTQPADGSATPLYTYVRNSGDNSAVQAMAGLSSAVLSFDAAGGLPTTQMSLQSYVSELLGYVSSTSAAATDNLNNTQVLYDGFKTRLEAATGVNLDEELANTVIFQNAYAATARIISTVDEMFKSLIDAV